MVSKAHAAQSVAVELLTFAPIGVMIALRRDLGRSEIWLAAVTAGLFSLAIETVRWFKPGLQPDFSNAIIAAAAAGLAVRLTALFWRVLGAAPIAAKTTIAPNLSPTVVALPDGASTDDRNRGSITLTGSVVSAICVPLAVVIAANYALAPWLVGAALAVYVAALWRWPSLWLVVLPAMLPALDFTPWTGWTLIGEPDCFALLTIGILALRSPPRRRDFLPVGL